MSLKPSNKTIRALNLLYEKNTAPKEIQRDPVELVHRYTKPREIEIAGLISALLAYGQIGLFKKVIHRILNLSEGRLFEYVLHFSPDRERPRFRGIYYRFNTEDDLFALIVLIRRVIQQYGSIGDCFLKHYTPTDPDIGPALSGFVRSLKTLLPKPISPGLKYLFPSPDSGSACKRFNLFLRWMVRPKDGIDFGIWETIPPSKLIMPLDTHIIRISQYLHLTTRKTADWKMAQEVTAFLKQCDPKDPLKYDFALCHLGISGACPTQIDLKKCNQCLLKNICFRKPAI